jgi:sialate O-acetylesterase
MKKYSLLMLGLWVCLGAKAQLTLHGLFTDSAVLQQGVSVPIWGTSAPKEKISVLFNQQEYKTLATTNGTWEVSLPVMPASEQLYSIVVKSPTETRILKNIVFGDVWLCSGQSNMEWGVRDAKNYEQERQTANDPLLRHLTIPKVFSGSPQPDIIPANWQTSHEATVAPFTAVGYFFAKNLRKTNKNLPIGLLKSAWGGTKIECWMSQKALGFENQAAIDAFHQNNKAYKISELKKYHSDISTTDEGMKNDVAQWVNPNLDDTQWRSLTMPSWFWGESREHHDGAFWLRKTFELKAHEIQNSILKLGHFTDAISIWLNGRVVEVNPTGNESKNYQYDIPAEWLQIGHNVLTIRIFDQGAATGGWAENNEYLLTSAHSKTILSGTWKYKLSAFQYLPEQQSDSGPMLIYHAMIAPLHKFPIKGVLWYQGESNCMPIESAFAYRHQLAAMIAHWRTAWNSPNLPFLVVQLTTFGALSDDPNQLSDWSVLRESQNKAVQNLPYTALATTLDVGDAQDIHPQDKQTVGHRLALLARKMVYNESIAAESPSYQSMKNEENTIRLQFKNVGSGLVVRDKYGYLKGFAVAGEDKVFHWAKAQIIGNDIIVSADAVPKPVAVRYAWQNSPVEANLFSKEGLPVGTFRTDDWAR